MPTASIYYVNPSGNVPPTSPLVGDPWDVTTYSDAIAATAALENHPDAVFLDESSVAEASCKELREACIRMRTPVFILEPTANIGDIAQAFEKARIDRQIDQLRDLGGDDFVTELIDLFLGQTPSQLAAMRDALTQGDSTALQKVAHTLKSSAGNFGGRVLQELCARTERAAMTDGSSLPALLNHVDDAFARVKEYLQSKR